jgi:hypothetical protein
LGLLTNAVQTLAGVLLPSATVFLLLLCNDEAVLGPWVNSRRVNLFTMLVIGLLVTLSFILTAAVLFPGLTGEAITTILALGAGVAVVGTAVALVMGRGAELKQPIDRQSLYQWQMPPLATLSPLKLSAMNRLWMLVLRGYLLFSVGLIVVRVTQLALAAHG